MSFSMRKYVIKKESIFCKNPLKFKLLLGTVVFREKKKKKQDAYLKHIILSFILCC